MKLIIDHKCDLFVTREIQSILLVLLLQWLNHCSNKAILTISGFLISIQCSIEFGNLLAGISIDVGIWPIMRKVEIYVLVVIDGNSFGLNITNSNLNLIKSLLGEQIIGFFF